jgi:hypothetical protein
MGKSGKDRGKDFRKRRKAKKAAQYSEKGRR